MSEFIVRGITSYGVHVPYHRLARAAIGGALGGPAGRGTRAVASYDEDTTTMAVEAARDAVNARPDIAIGNVWLATALPAYVDKTNAGAIHAALRLAPQAAAADFGGAVRSGIATLRAAFAGGQTTLVALSDIRTGRPGSADEREGGDGAAAFVLSDDGESPVIAELLGAASVTEEFLDRWRLPGELASQQWEERFGETKYRPLVAQAWSAGLADAGQTAEQIDRAVVTGTHARAVRAAAGGLGLDDGVVVDDLAATVGNTGTAHAGMLLAVALDDAGPGEVIAVVSLADGVDVLILRTTDAIAEWTSARPVASQIEAGNPELPYAKFLSWRGMVELEPPRRPAPERPSASAAGRSVGWKYGLVGGRDRTSGMVHLPPQRKAEKGGALDDMEPVAMADIPGTVVTATVDHVSYSPSPPIIAAVVDFDGGGRMPVELTDTDESGVSPGDRVEMTFRRLYTSYGIHNYFWKARPVRDDRGAADSN